MAKYLNNKRYAEPFDRGELVKFSIDELVRIASTKKVSVKNALIDLLISTNK